MKTMMTRSMPGETSRPVAATAPQRMFARALPRRLAQQQGQQQRPPTYLKGLAREVFASHPEIEGDPQGFLKVTEAYWKTLRLTKHEPHKKGPAVITYGTGKLEKTDYDVVISGGTLGLFLATALQQRGYRVAIVEKRLCRGRNQEWNISRGEISTLTELGLMTQAELEAAIISEFNPIRVGFKGGPEIWVRDCLNLGVHPRTLLATLRTKFLLAGGVLMENTTFKGAEILEGGMRMKLKPGGKSEAMAVGDVNRPNGMESIDYDEDFVMPAPRPTEITTRLLLDCMGHYSDIVKQIRGRVRPDGMCLVVGSCAEGFPKEMNQTADLLYSLTDAHDDLQLFWEAFPAEGGRGRTTYMFAYSDADPARPTFESLLDLYFKLLPQYQGIPLEELRFKRVLFGGFPCYSDGPLAPAFDRVMQIGDASCAQSPLSFGGFGSMIRHLGRLTRAVSEALDADRLSKEDLGWIQPYQPSLSASWLFQRSMSVGVGQAKYPAGLETFQGMLQQQEKEHALASTSSASTSTSSSTSLATTNGISPSSSSSASSSSADGLASLVRVPHTHINEILGCNFGVMSVLGDRVLRPFLQDTIQLIPLSLSMTGMMLANPVVISRVLFQVGPKTLSSWFFHYAALIVYSLGHAVLSPLRGTIKTYGFQRLLDALEYGSGFDYNYHPSPEPAVPPPPPVKAAIGSGQPAQQQQQQQQQQPALQPVLAEGESVKEPARAL